MSELKAGEWNELERTSDEFPAGFVRTGGLNNFVIQFGGTVKGTIKVDDVQIWGNVEVEDAKPILAIGFDTQTETDNVKFDNAEGGLTESALSAATAKFWGYATLPFSWIANTWKGSDGLDLSNSESAVDLTPRGEEIVNGDHGIKETSGVINFK
jgi:hypothetical protein